MGKRSDLRMKGLKQERKKRWPLRIKEGRGEKTQEEKEIALGVLDVRGSGSKVQMYCHGKRFTVIMNDMVSKLWIKYDN